MFLQYLYVNNTVDIFNLIVLPGLPPFFSIGFTNKVDNLHDNCVLSWGFILPEDQDLPHIVCLLTIETGFSALIWNKFGRDNIYLRIVPSAEASVILSFLKIGTCSPIELNSPIIVAILPVHVLFTLDGPQWGVLEKTLPFQLNLKCLFNCLSHIQLSGE